jgi:hypothetical protein
MTNEKCNMANGKGNRGEISAQLFSQINRANSEGGFTRVAPLVVEAALSSERSIGGAFARLFNKRGLSPILLQRGLL